mmetsp:Transcript_28577/g.88429  ORF Transcript_28577/g.88429 Transcript_28577/m.88429 type:complete len:202 (+) Transcript_28577:644-1249(+)
MRTCWPIGKPRTCSGDGSAKRSRNESDDSWMRFESVSLTRAFFLSVILDDASSAAATASPSPCASVPMAYWSRCAQALREWIAANSSVQSVPAFIVMDDAPPGWSWRYAFVSYTTPLTAIQQSVGESCFARSASVNVVDGTAPPPTFATTLGASSLGASSGARASARAACMSLLAVAYADSSDRTAPASRRAWGVIQPPGA